MEITEPQLSMFHEIVEHWVNSYIQQIETLTNPAEESSATDQKTLYIIAISRKMPRFIDWIEKQFLQNRPELKEKYSSAVSKCRLTSEIALPFLFTNATDDELSKTDVLVIDDTIVLGNTMRTVASNVEDYLGRPPHVSALVAKRDFMAHQLSASSVNIQTIIPSDDIIEKWMRFVCDSNRSTCLPIDVEFPILYSDADIAHIEELLKFKKDDSYSVGKDSTRSFNILFNSSDLRDYKIDFSKLRVFKNGDKTKLSFFAPRFIRQQRMEDPSLFKNSLISRVWNKILKKFRLLSQSVTRGYQSLAVAINYLYSLSSYNENIGNIRNFPAAYVDSKDLNFLFGSSLSEEIKSDLSEILKKCEVEPKVLGEVDLPDSFVSEDLRNSILNQAFGNSLADTDIANEYKDYKFEVQRLYILSKHEFNAYTKVIKKVFDLSHFAKGLLGSDSGFFHQIHSTFFETFDSMNNLLAQGGNGLNFYMLINKSIDDLIDKGYIIPRYKAVRSSTGEIFWRRFFTSSGASVNI